MTQQTRTTNKAAFEQGDTPQGSNYVDLIDSFVALADSTAQSMTSDLSVPTLIATEVSANRVNTGTVSVSGTSTFTGIIYASATAVFQGSVYVSGTAVFNKPIHASATAVFGTVVRIGTETGRGYAVAIQNATIAAINSAGNPVDFNLPSGSDITNLWITIEAPFASGVVTANRINSRVGATANLVSEIAVSASGQYNLLRTPTVGGAADLLRNVTATVRVFQSMKATGSAATSGQGILTIQYIVK